MPPAHAAPLLSSHPPPQLPQVLRTFTNEVQLGLLLPGPFELELPVIAVEFLSREGRWIQMQNLQSFSLPQVSSPWSGALDPLSPCQELQTWGSSAHQPWQAQITDDGQNDNSTGCDKIAEGTFRQLRATWGRRCQRSEAGPVPPPCNHQGDRQADGRTYWRWRRSWPQRRRSLPSPGHS